MAWIKRNLYFLIGSIIALGLMIFGVFVLLSQMSAEQQAAENIQKQYAELTRLNTGPASPENIEEAKKQEVQLRAYVKKVRGFFQPVVSATTNKVSNADFATDLRNTIVLLRRTAEQQSVDLPPDYYFSFEAQRKMLVINAGSLESLAMHLGEIKVICGILFNAKVNYLVGIQREIISDTDDTNPPDYLTEKTVTTPLADLTPYQVTFKSFSTELAEVLAGFASSTNCFIVKSINVEPAGSAADDQANMVNNPAPSPSVMPAMPGRSPYGGFNPMYPGARGNGGYIPPMTPTPAPVAQPVNRGSQAFLNEKPFRVTLYLELVKLKTGK